MDKFKIFALKPASKQVHVVHGFYIGNEKKPGNENCCLLDPDFYKEILHYFKCVSIFFIWNKRRSHGVRRIGLSRRKQRLNRSLDDLLRIAKNNARHALLHALSSIPVSRLKPILDEADRRSLRHSDWFKLKMIMAFSFNKLFPRIPPLPPKTQFIKIKFVNKGLDLLNISDIFRDHRVTSKIPQNFENLDPPLICYQYKSPIRNIIFKG